jgi:5-methylthioadenosine/S-adenosylhomocysteine deaminase
MERNLNHLKKSQKTLHHDKRCSVRTDNPKTILVRNVPYLITATAFGTVETLKNRSIWIENGVIQDVCDAAEGERYSAKADLIYDAAEKGGVVVTPGFINTHAHSHMYLMRSTLLLEEGEDIDQTIAAMPRWQQFETDESMCIAAIGDFTEQQKYGITTTLSQGPSFEAIEHAAEKTRQRAFNAVSAVSNSRPNNTIAFVEQHLQAKQHAYSLPAVSIHYLYKASDETLREIKRLVEQYRILFTFHLAESEFVRNACIENYGKTEIDRLEHAGLLNNRTLCSHAIYLHEKEIERLIAARVGIAHLPTSNAIHKSGRFALELFYKRGGQDHISLGTDSVISKNRLDLLTESFQTKLTHLNFHALTYAELFKMMTINAARILGLKDVGIIAPGYKADLAFWALQDRGFIPYDEKNPISLLGNMINHGGRITRDLMINGVFVISNRIHNFVHETRLLGLIQAEHMHIREKFRKL